MVQQNKLQNAEELYNQYAEEQPVRESDDTVGVGSYSEDGDEDRPLDYFERSSPTLTDLQFLIKTLSPDFKEEVYNYLLVGRLSPDMFRPMFRLLVNNEVRRQRIKRNVDVIKIATKIYTILTICLDGKHIVDILEAFGSKADSQEIDQLARGMGMGLS